MMGVLNGVFFSIPSQSSSRKKYGELIDKITMWVKAKTREQGRAKTSLVSR